MSKKKQNEEPKALTAVAGDLKISPAQKSDLDSLALSSSQKKCQISDLTEQILNLEKQRELAFVELKELQKAFVKKIEKFAAQNGLDVESDEYGVHFDLDTGVFSKTDKK
jgi:hypothetical protein